MNDLCFPQATKPIQITNFDFSMTAFSLQRIHLIWFLSALFISAFCSEPCTGQSLTYGGPVEGGGVPIYCRWCGFNNRTCEHKLPGRIGYR